MKKQLLFLTLATVLASPATAAAKNKPLGHTGGLDSVHQPVVQTRHFVLDLVTAYDGLSAGEQQRLNGWLQALQVGYGDTLSLDGGRGYLVPQVRAEVARAAGQYGLMISDVSPVTEGAIADGRVRVVLTRSTASVPSCPGLSGVEIAGMSNRNPTNFGCALNGAWAMMVANPEDLLSGRSGSSVIDAQTLNKAITTYRTKPATGASELKADKLGGGR